MNLLTLCSALNNSYISFKTKDKIYSEIIKSDENYHSLYLIKKIKDTLSDNNVTLNDFDAYAVNCGPGSFTGIRVALTVAKVITGELNKPLIPLNTAEILLNAYKADFLIMDARRDMYFVGDKNNIELIKKDKLEEKLTDIKNKKIICDKRCLDIINNAICFEDTDIDLGKIMLQIAEEKYKTGNKEDFNCMKVEANYIQTPPIF